MHKEKLISIVDLLLGYGWLIDFLPDLQAQVKVLVEVDPDYGLKNSSRYIETVCILLPKIFESFCTSKDLFRRENLVKNCFSLPSYNDPNTIALLQIMANHCNTLVYDLCEKMYGVHVTFDSLSQNERLIVNFLEDKGLVLQLLESNSPVYCLSWLGEDLASLWLPTDKQYITCENRA